MGGPKPSPSPPTVLICQYWKTALVVTLITMGKYHLLLKWGRFAIILESRVIIRDTLTIRTCNPLSVEIDTQHIIKVKVHKVTLQKCK